MILACHNINKSFGEHVIVHDGSFHIEEREKAALVGINGAGKSTILKMIMGEEPLDGGDVILAKGKTIGYLAQHQDLLPGSTIYEEVRSARADIFALESQIRSVEEELKHLSGDALKERLDTYNRLQSEFEDKNGYACESEITGVLKGLGFTEDDFSKLTDTLSGGQKTRVSLGKLLLTKPDVLLLDEPTNHLDLNSVSWLETFLMNYPGAVFIVSHDRYFLNRVVTKVVEIEHGEIRTYLGNYKAYSAKKQQIRDAQLKEYLNQQREIRHQQAVIEKLRSFNREKSIRRAESREKMLEKISPVEKPAETVQEMHLTLEPAYTSGNDVLSVDRLSKQFDGQILFRDVSFEIKRGEHVAVIGDNGTGKTTLLKILNQVIRADSGSFTLGAKVKIGYYDQEHHVLHDDKTIFEEISDDYPSLNNTQIRNTLAAFQFTGDDVFKEIRSLSGGEKGRVSLAKLMLSEANFLILDEPTNHLDITSKEILEEALNSYSGTVLYVSHDRYFINQTASRILELVNQTFVNYIGNYDYYLEKKEELTRAYSTPGSQAGSSGSSSAQVSESKLSWQEQKEQQAKERKRKNDLKKTEEEISRLEDRNSQIDHDLTLEEVYSNSVKCQELSTERAENETRLEELYELWEGLAEE
ncbi:ABC-F family ATP-binding cassette domain-containing protein [Mediterraneibacter glycyrrhizinilyticus]|uniref:ribosomal protection-like ABC-F family protein n=1 Tax=Mediterraneibacter glycyrrhizinilyticus TaxID=342942 RepID=UPI001960727D|nr:ABC-F family ATP-binding cassette domain-containing protein [Mediterraneibacter glycyrrhizinilyticus]MBM6750663.1 ABC-F family ATP-binding cassette domain-containing protein [Mediterraneibacter glycyrrhizinilyticus]